MEVSARDLSDGNVHGKRLCATQTLNTTALGHRPRPQSREEGNDETQCDLKIRSVATRANFF